MRLVGAGGAEQSCFLEVHGGLQFEQDDVVDATLVPKLGDGTALVFEHAKAHLANQIEAGSDPSFFQLHTQFQAIGACSRSGQRAFY